LIEADDDPDRVHPLKQYVRRRGGRVGQLFHGVIIHHGDNHPVYDDMVQLAGWADTERGKTGRFWLDEEAERHPFAGYKKRNAKEPGSLFGFVLVQLTDDHKPVDQDALASAEALQQPPGKRKLSAEAHLMVTSHWFVQYLKERVKQPRSGPWTAESARRWVKWKIQIESLSDLDRSEEKAHRFHEEIRKPFAKWSGPRDRD